MIEGKPVCLESSIFSKSTNKAYPEVHHCIDVFSVTTMGDLFEAFHYDINEAHNTVVMPSIMQVACQLAVPRHKGEHGRGRKFADDPSKGKDKANIENLEKLEDDHAGKKYKAVITEERSPKYITYVEAVCDELNDIREIQPEEWECYDEVGQPKSETEMKAEFETEMTKISEKTLSRLADFSWTLSADGRDYRPGNKTGCSGAHALHKSKKNKDIIKKKRGNICTAGEDEKKGITDRDHGFSVEKRTLKLGQ